MDPIVEPGRCLMIGLPGPTLDRRSRGRLRRLAPAGLLLFSRNLESPGQVRELVGEFRALADRPSLVAIDQEGGRVSRLAPWIGPTPTAARLALRGERAARTFGRATAEILRNLGIALDFAPVVDLSRTTAANGIGDRAWSVDPDLTARMAGAFLGGLQAAGVAGCLKHFPGLGATRVDSHAALPTDSRRPSTFRRRDLVPFRRLVAAAATVMVGHGHYPALDPGPPRPATCAPPIVDALLRRRLGFAGTVVSDDMEMGAVRDRDREGSAALEAIDAGCDLLLYCQDLDRAEAARDALAREAERSAAFRRRLAEAGSRVAALADRWPPAPGSDETLRAAVARLPRPAQVRVRPVRISKISR